MFDLVKKFIEEAKKKQQEKQNKLNNYILSIDDEIVKKSSFLPLKKWWNANITHELRNDNYWNIIFKKKKWVSFIAIFVSFIMIILFYKFFSIIEIKSLILEIKLHPSFLYLQLIPSFLILILFLLMIFIGLFWYSYIFDFQNGYFYNTKYKNKLFTLLNNEKYNNKFTPINQIQALQIISERVSWKNSIFMSYELNMILKNSDRINIIDHWAINEIRKNALELWSRLWVKIYDLTQVLVNESY